MVWTNSQRKSNDISEMKKLIFLISASLFFFKISYSENSDIYKKIDLFGEVLEKINKEYVDEVDQSKSMDSAINGLLQSLDPYSAYMSPESFDSMQTETSGEFGGLGIEVGMEAGVVKVISPIDDTPASRAGLKAGDYIVKINDSQVQGKSLMDAVELMRGPVGSSIEITVRRRGEKKALIFNIVREVIEVQSVKFELLNNNIGYIRLTSFNENSSQQVKEKIEKFNKNENLKGFVLDLRNNPGGLLSQAIKISDFFLENGEIVSTKSRQVLENRKWFAKKGDLTNGKTLIVLINYGSASASEIVAGALKDHKRAIILGENSYGKGSVQSIIPLKNKGAIRITIAKYYLPSGKSISKVGVTPDIEIIEDSDQFEINTESDNQLNFALKLLNGWMTNNNMALPLRSGVGIVVLNNDNKVFVAKRIDNQKNFWQMPQGGVNEGEDYLAAAYRELEEETSINKVELIKTLNGLIVYELPKNLIGIIWKGRYRGQEQKWFVMRFLGKDSDINIKTKNPEFCEWKWIEIEKLTDHVVDFKLHVYKSIKKSIKEITNL